MSLTDISLSVGFYIQVNSMLSGTDVRIFRKETVENYLKKKARVRVCLLAVVAVGTILIR